MSEFVTLKAPPGTDEINHAGIVYRTDTSGRIRVPAEIWHHFVGVAGFERVDDDPAVTTVERKGVTRLRTPAHIARGSRIVTKDGTPISVDAEGIAEIAYSLHWRTDPGIDGFEPPGQGRVTGHVGELLRLGFQHLPTQAP